MLISNSLTITNYSSEYENFAKMQFCSNLSLKQAHKLELFIKTLLGL